jgi:hypothetical protein
MPSFAAIVSSLTASLVVQFIRILVNIFRRKTSPPALPNGQSPCVGLEVKLKFESGDGPPPR